jgi:hypothetical protein
MDGGLRSSTSRPDTRGIHLESQEVMLEAWEIAADRKTHAQGHIQQHHRHHTRPVQQFQLILQALNSATSYPRSGRLHDPPPLAQAGRPIHRVACRDTLTIPGNVSLFRQWAYSSRAPQQDEARLLNPQQRSWSTTHGFMPSTYSKSDVMTLTSPYSWDKRWKYASEPKSKPLDYIKYIIFLTMTPPLFWQTPLCWILYRGG